jgi:N-acetylmuramoyl-L-alanine amidase
MELRDPSSIQRIIIHCSDADYQHDVHDINNWHLENGWDMVGYHYVVNNRRPFSFLEVGRQLKYQGAHVWGFNSNSIGICLCGKDTFSHQQFKILASLLKNLFWIFGLTKSDVYGHNEFDKHKDCPNFSIEKFFDDYLGGRRCQ